MIGNKEKIVVIRRFHQSFARYILELSPHG